MRLMLKPLLVCCFYLTCKNTVAADSYLSYNVLERHFYQPGKIEFLQNSSSEQMLDYLKGSGLDRWARFHRYSALSSLVSTYERNGFGLRLLEYPGRFYLLPEIDSPNETLFYEIFEVLQPPMDGDWRKALEDDLLTLADKHANRTFISDQYVSSGIRLLGNYLRVDDFTNPGFESDLVAYDQRLNKVRIIDLRFNGGGKIDYAYDLFQRLAGADVYAGYQSRREDRVDFGGSADITRLPSKLSETFVLVSRHTASAAEWLARNLQHYGATVVGERTVGKCVVHSVFPVGNREYFEIAVGEVRAASETLYSHCNYGIIPNLYIEERVLIESDGKQLIDSLKACQIESNPDSAKIDCSGVSGGVLFDEIHLKEAGDRSTTDQVDESVRDQANGDLLTKVDSEESTVTKSPSSSLAEPGHVSSICVEPEWTLLLGSYLNRGKAVALVEKIDEELRPLLVSVAADGRQFHRVVIRSVVGEENAKALRKQLDDLFEINSVLIRNNRSEAYTRHMEAMVPDEEYIFVEDPENGACLFGKFTNKEVDDLIAHLDEMTSIKIISKP